MPKPIVVAVVGPTAVGKSDLAMRLARQTGGEIVSADSRQVYRHMDLGTAKPSRADRDEVSHHLVDFVDPDEDYSLALFLKQARAAIDDVVERQRLPIVVGGTGQYVWGLLEGWQVPEVPPNEELRRDLEHRAEADGVQSLYDELVRLDPEAAARVDGRNPRRVIRALEVYHSAGESPTSATKRPPPFDALIVGLTLERRELYKRIDERVGAMVEAGWLDEVRGLLDRGYALDLPSMSSVGYQELSLHLAGETTLEEAVERIKGRTHRFARQQYNWFQLDDERIHWFRSTPEGTAESVELVKRRLAARTAP